MSVRDKGREAVRACVRACVRVRARARLRLNRILCEAQALIIEYICCTEKPQTPDIDRPSTSTFSNTTSLTSAEELTQKALADANSIRNFRNTQRSVGRMNGEADVNDNY